MQMNERFLSHETILSSFQILLVPTALDQQNNSLLQKIIEFYKTDLDCSFRSFVSEFEIWQKKVEMLSRPLKNVEDALSICNPTVCENIYKLLVIFATLPVSSCENERSFSTLRRLKTFLRANTTEQRLNGLALLHIYRDLSPSTEEVIEEMAQQGLKL